MSYVQEAHSIDLIFELLLRVGMPQIHSVQLVQNELQ
jgi:hypothetical protein